jgi:hypothetical protein
VFILGGLTQCPTGALDDEDGDLRVKCELDLKRSSRERRLRWFVKVCSCDGISI